MSTDTTTSLLPSNRFSDVVIAASQPSSHARMPREAARQQTVERIQCALRTQDESLDRLTRLLARLADCPVACINLVTRGQLEVISSYGLSGNDDPGYRQPFSRFAVARNDLLIINNIAEDPQFANDPSVTGGQQWRFYAGMPIHAPNGLAIGTFSLLDRQARELTTEQELAMRDLAASAGEVLLLRTLSVRDPLTGFFGDDYIESLLDRDWLHAYRHLLPVSIVVARIDDPQIYAHEIGEPTADVPLRQSANVIAQTFRRRSDLIARHGHDGFVIVLPETNEIGAVALANRLCTSVAAAAIPHQSDRGGVLTISAGVAVAQSENDLLNGWRPLIHRAETALDNLQVRANAQRLATSLV